MRDTRSFGKLNHFYINSHRLNIKIFHYLVDEKILTLQARLNSNNKIEKFKVNKFFSTINLRGNYFNQKFLVHCKMFFKHKRIIKLYLLITFSFKQM